MSSPEQDSAACRRCGRRRRVHMGITRKSAPLCRDCLVVTDGYPGVAVGPVDCPHCGRTLGNPGALAQHTRHRHPEGT